MSVIEHDETAKALIEARAAIHRLCLERGSTDGYGAVFKQVNAALTAHQGAVAALDALRHAVREFTTAADYTVERAVEDALVEALDDADRFGGQ